MFVAKCVCVFFQWNQNTEFCLGILYMGIVEEMSLKTIIGKRLYILNYKNTKSKSYCNYPKYLCQNRTCFPSKTIISINTYAFYPLESRRTLYFIQWKTQYSISPRGFFFAYTFLFNVPSSRSLSVSVSVSLQKFCASCSQTEEVFSGFRSVARLPCLPQQPRAHFLAVAVAVVCVCVPDCVCVRVCLCSEQLNSKSHISLWSVAAAAQFIQHCFSFTAFSLFLANHLAT